jgi:hypothetical protein
MKINDEVLQKSFTLPNPNISHHGIDFVPFNLVVCNQDTLLVTFGDSWTWGDDLTNECLKQSTRRLDIIKDLQYFRGLYHPLIEGHQAWSKYLEKKL